jgi:hypothetical protein
MTKSRAQAPQNLRFISKTPPYKKYAANGGANTTSAGTGKKTPPRSFLFLWFMVRESAAPRTSANKSKEERKTPIKE